MCSDFQAAALASVFDTCSGARPSALRCWFTRVTTWLANVVLTVPHAGPEAQLPTAAAEVGAKTAAARTATTARRARAGIEFLSSGDAATRVAGLAPSRNDSIGGRMYAL